MPDRNFMDLLQARWNEGKFVCVGLDSDVQKLPSSIATVRDTQFAFNKRIVDATSDLVCCYKPNLAFYGSFLGFEMLRLTIKYITSTTDVPVILDAKQADIGSTNDGYVLEDFGFFGADAVTLNPYLGKKAMEPFLEQKDKGNIYLCRTSNPGAGEFQDLVCEVYDGDHEIYADPEDAASFPRGVDVGVIQKMPLYQVVARNVATIWNYNGNCAVVAGATSPAELGKIRKIVGDMPILIPGIGAQGGELEASVRAGVNSREQGMIINSSRGIIFASDGSDFAEAARREVQKLHNDISAVLAQI